MSSAVENPATDNPADNAGTEVPVPPQTLGPDATAADARAISRSRPRDQLGPAQLRQGPVPRQL